MIYLQLFLTFLKIGAVSVGGGLSMISLICESVTSNGWMTEAELLNFIAVSESTPGPIAVNIATFIGSSQGGIWGAFFATLGIVLPSFIIILIIAAAAASLMKREGVKAVMNGVHPCIVGLILATGIGMLLSKLTGIETIHSAFAFDWKSALLLAALVLFSLVYRLLRKKGPSLILLILLSGAAGACFFQ